MNAHPRPDSAPGSTTDDARDADALVMFGITGDLGDKKLLPALAELAAAGRLDHPVVGVGRREIAPDELADRLRSAIDERADDSPLDPGIVDELDLHYVSGDATDPATFDSVLDVIGPCAQPVVYGALPPSLFGDLARALDASDMPDVTRLVVEKPFGENAESARELYDDITTTLDPDRLFIVDHFLAKPAIENLLTVRTKNALLANSLRQGLVERVDLVFAEDGGVDGRGSFYESVGALRDVVQNHLLQELALATMDPPDDDSVDAYVAARRRLLESIRPADPTLAIRGQYDGYRDLDDVDAASDVETFVGLELRIDREPWRDVPITITTGKRLADPRNVLTITLADSCLAGRHVPNNRIEFAIKPTPSVAFDLAMLDPETHRPVRVRVSHDHRDDHGLLSDYAVMLDNAKRGERRHFADIEGIVAAWHVIDPLLVDPPPLERYAPGTDGPVR